MTTNFVYEGLNLIASGFGGLQLPDVLLVLMIMVAFLFGIQDYRIGLIIQFLGSILLYIFFTLFNLPVLNATILIFISLILLTISLFVEGNNGKLFS